MIVINTASDCITKTNFNSDYYLEIKSIMSYSSCSKKLTLLINFIYREIDRRES